MTDRPNFYTLLEIDPSVDHWPAIEQRIREKREEWSRDRSMGSPKARRRAAIALAQLPEIQRTLQDPVSRHREASEAGREDQRTRQRELQDAVELLKTGGGKYSDSQFQSLVKRFMGVWTPEEIRELLQAAGVRSGSAASRTTEDQIDKVAAGSLRRNLEQLGSVTLYDFLGLTPESSPASLSVRAQEIYKENLRTGRTDADSSARNELAGLAAMVFQDDREKSRYDNHLAAEALESLKPLIDLAGSDGFLSGLELAALVRQARQRGLSTMVAHRLIEDYAAARNWSIEAEVPIEVSEDDEPFLYSKEGLFSPGTVPSRNGGLSAEYRKLASVAAKKITNVSSKSFGFVVFGPGRLEMVKNLFLADESVPRSSSLSIEIHEEGLRSLEIRCAESSSHERKVPLSACREIGKVLLDFDPPPPVGARIEITFMLGPEGLLTLESKDHTGSGAIRPTFQTAGVLSQRSLAVAKDRNHSLTIAPRSQGLTPLVSPRPLAQSAETGGRRNQVFVSYSHSDIKWLERLQKHLKQLIRTDTVSLWDDTKIKPGAFWRQEIQKALERARVAVLLVSKDFIDSDFIVEHELPQLLKAAKETNNLTILWLCLGHCLVEDTEIMDFQAVNNPKRPLASLRRPVDQDKVLTHLCRMIKETINDKQKRAEA